MKSSALPAVTCRTSDVQPTSVKKRTSAFLGNFGRPLGPCMHTTTEAMFVTYARKETQQHNAYNQANSARTTNCKRNWTASRAKICCGPVILAAYGLKDVSFLSLYPPLPSSEGSTSAAPSAATSRNAALQMLVTEDRKSDGSSSRAAPERVSTFVYVRTCVRVNDTCVAK